MKFTLLLSLFVVPSLHAYLGSFEGGGPDGGPADPTAEPDGYRRNNIEGGNGVQAQDVVVTYNAGAYNTTNGGPGGVYTVGEQGVWTDNLHPDGTGINYGAPYYAMSHRELPSAADPSEAFAPDGESFLGLRSDGTGNGSQNELLSFNSALDIFDFNGVDPASVTSGEIKWEIFICPIVVPGFIGDDYFHWTFRDTAGNIAFELGYNSENFLQYRSSPSDSWTVTTFLLTNDVWDTINVCFDLDNQQFDVSVFDNASTDHLDFDPDNGTLVSIVNDAQFGSDVENIASIDWTLQPFGRSVKNYFDNSVFTVVPPEPGSISGNVTEDTDNDNIGEDAIANVTIELFADTDGDGRPDGDAVATTTTNGAGDYVFTNVVPGDYVVVETQPAGFATVTDADESTPGDDVANGSTTDNQIPVSVVGGEDDTENNFVEELIVGSIAGNVTEDINNDDIGEDAIANVTIELFADINGDGQPDGDAVATTTTNGAGDYVFTNVVPGDYVVVETCLLYTSPSPRDKRQSRMPSSA